MITDVQAQLKAALAALVTDWPIRWPNEPWPTNTNLSQGNYPLADDGNPTPFIEAEVIAAQSSATAGSAGKRRGRDSGLFRVYLSVPVNSGTDTLNTKSDAIYDAFKRVTVWLDPVTTKRLITMDPRIDDGVAAYEDGSLFTRMISTPWNFDFPN